MPKNVVVTGGTGFVGANLARRLIAEGHKVHLLVRPGYSNWRIADIFSHIELHQIPLSQDNSLELRSFFKQVKPDWIFHLAVHGAYSWQNNFREIIDTNLTGTISLLEQALDEQFEAFINVGSSSEYGFKDHAPTEGEILEPNSCYAVAKAAATHYCQYAARRENAPIFTARLYSVFGPYEAPERLIPQLIAHAKKGGFPPLVNPNTARDYIFVEDACDAMMAIAQAGNIKNGSIFNVGTGIQTSLSSVIALAAEYFGIKATPKWGSMQNRQWDSDTWVADPHFLASETGWTARHTFEDGFRKTIEWSER